MKSTTNRRSFGSGFTIVELLVVIVVIGILAAITITSYTGITQRANLASVQSDLESAVKVLKLFQVDNGNYPLTIDCAQADSTINKCVKASGANSLTYQADNSASPQAFSLTVANSSAKYRVYNDSTPTQVSLVCPHGFVVVPGSSTYGTSDFCVMKYEAKQDSATVPISRSSGLPWVSITQTDSITYSQNVSNCTGCHLMTEAEWLTLAQNALGVASNWSGGAVGSGYIYSGHSDNDPTSAQAADSSDLNNYINTNDFSGDGGTTNGKIGDTERRTLNLSNGEVIWDLAGNVYEWMNTTIAGGQQPGLAGEVAYAWKQWNNGSLLQNGLPNSSMPSYTGLSGASGWSSAQGIGQVYSNYSDSVVKAYRRGGNWAAGTGAGILALSLSGSASNATAICGFRVAK